MTFNKFLKRLYKAYPYLNDTRLEYANAWGITQFSPQESSIVFYLEALRPLQNSSRFIKRFGKSKSFNDFLIKTILHEVCHVHQYLYDYKKFCVGSHEIDITIEHDRHPLEIAADQFARKEFKRWHLTKLKF